MFPVWNVRFACLLWLAKLPASVFPDSLLASTTLCQLIKAILAMSVSLFLLLFLFLGLKFYLGGPRGCSADRRASLGLKFPEEMTHFFVYVQAGAINRACTNRFEGKNRLSSSPATVGRCIRKYTTHMLTRLVIHKN